jgi:hypothetical protein
VAQTVRALHMILGGGEAQQAQAFLLVDGCTAALQESRGERSAAIDIAMPWNQRTASASSRATPLLAMHPPQAVRECAPSPSRRRTGKKFSPSAAMRHTHQRLASGRHGRNALAQIVDV